MKFAIIDLTGKLAAADLAAYAVAQETQLRQDVAPLHEGVGSDAAVRAIAGAAELEPGEVPVYWNANAPTDAASAGAIALHDRLPDGTPIINGYADLAAESDDPWTAVLSHEVIETLIDPDLDGCCELSDGTIIDHEACDRVQAQSYEKNGVTLSSFNSRWCFAPPAGGALPPGEKYDFLGSSTSGNQTMPGGYSQTFTSGEGWRMVEDDMVPQSLYRRRLHELGLSRRARRAARAARGETSE
jgi:hypothetical protein